jgi:hypothetical protein
MKNRPPILWIFGGGAVFAPSLFISFISSFGNLAGAVNRKQGERDYSLKNGIMNRREDDGENPLNCEECGRFGETFPGFGKELRGSPVPQSDSRETDRFEFDIDRVERESRRTSPRENRDRVVLAANPRFPGCMHEWIGGRKWQRR